jgi:hypothetical protein
VNDRVGADTGEQFLDTYAVAYIQLGVAVAGYVLPQPLERPTGISLWAKKYRAFIVVHAENGVAVPRKVDRDF